MAEYWGLFRLKGPRRKMPEELYTFEVHHGGYFEKQLDGISMKYKVGRENKDGGKCFIDGLDPDKISWLELHNIAWDLGYTERPICFYFKCPGTSVSEGWVRAANDGAAVEMLKLLPKNRTIGLYIVGGGRRKKEEAELNHLNGESIEGYNPLTLSTPAELATVFEDANVAATILNRPEMNVGSARVVGEGSSASLNCGAQGQQSQSTFANLDDIVHDFFTQPTQESPQVYEVQVADGDVHHFGLGLGLGPGPTPIPIDECSGSDSEEETEKGEPATKDNEAEEGEEDRQRAEEERLRAEERQRAEEERQQKKEFARRAKINAAIVRRLRAEERQRVEEERQHAEFARRAKDINAAILRRQQEADLKRRAADLNLIKRGKAKQKQKETAAKEKPSAAEKGKFKECAVQQPNWRERREKPPRYNTRQRNNEEPVADPPSAAEKGKFKVQQPNLRERREKPPRYNTRQRNNEEPVADRADSEKAETDSEEASWDGESDGSGSEVGSFYGDSDYEDGAEEAAGFAPGSFAPHGSDPHNVEEFVEMGYKGEYSDDGVDKDDLNSVEDSDSEQEEVGEDPGRQKVKKGFTPISWNSEVDLKNPVFKLGHAFPDSDQLKEAVKEQSIGHQKGLWFQKNTKKKVEVRCQLECPYWLYAARIKGCGDTLFIKSLNQFHNCAPIVKCRWFDYNRVAEDVKDDLMVDPNWNRIGIQNQLQKKHKLDIGIQVVARGRDKARRMNEGHFIAQYNSLSSYRTELLKRNPGSTVEIKTVMDGDIRRFQRMYVCFAATKEGWINGCRPLVGLDGTHITNRYHKGVIITVVGVDPNNGMFPIAFAICEIEDQDVWMWFLELLKFDLKIERESSYAFISDKQKGLQNSIKHHFPGAEHRFCVRHLYNNFKDKHPGEGLKQSIWNAARSTTVPWFNKHMLDLKMQKPAAYDWFSEIEDRHPKHWCRAFFNPDIKCDLLLNNLCESWNNVLKEARDKPIITLVEKIRMDIMVRLANRCVAVTRWRQPVGPRIVALVNKEIDFSCNYRCFSAGLHEFQVLGTGESGTQHVVDLNKHECSCKRWQCSGIVCHHGICCLRSRNLVPYFFCDEALTRAKYEQAYGHVLHPIAGQEFWEVVDFPIAPPKFKKQAGRPAKKRRLEHGERVAPPSREKGYEKLKKTYSRMTCQRCFTVGHNRVGCPLTKAEKVAAAAANAASSSQGTTKYVRQQRPMRKDVAAKEGKIEHIISRRTYKLAKEQAAAAKKAAGAIMVYVAENVGTKTSQNQPQKETE